MFCFLSYWFLHRFEAFSIVVEKGFLKVLKTEVKVPEFNTLSEGKGTKAILKNLNYEKK